MVVGMWEKKFQGRCHLGAKINWDENQHEANGANEHRFFGQLRDSHHRPNLVV
jgi:hypothetical protein